MGIKLPFTGLLVLATMSVHSVAHAQFANRPIRIVVTTAPGGAPDIAARLLGERLSKNLGRPIVVENKTGANGNIAGEYVARSEPDGHTLILTPDSVITINPHVYGRMPFDPLSRFVPVASVYQNHFILAVHPSVPASTLPDFIAHARKVDPPLRYASAGPGSLHHFGIEMLKRRAEVPLSHVPYRGGAPAATATVAGETHVVLAGVGAAGLIQSGKLRALATTGGRRSPEWPDLPSIAEFYPGYDLTAWAGLFAPAGTPEAVVSRLRAEVQSALADPDFAKKLGNVGLEPLGLSAEDFGAMVRRDHERYGKIAREIGLKIE